jgi:hypothetical protein
MSRSRAVTLIELLIYMFLLGLLLFAIYSLLLNGRRMWAGATASYLISADFEAGVRAMRADLKEGCLISMRSFPNPTYAEAVPGFSMAAPRSIDNPRQFVVTSAGAPGFQKYVFYTLQPNGPQSTTARLVRWEKAIDPSQGTPQASLDLPQLISDNSHSHVIFQNLLLAGHEYPIYETGGQPLKTDSHGGFHISFVYYAEDGSELLRDFNPAEVVAANGKGFDVSTKSISHLVNVELQGLTVGDSGKPSYYDMHFRIAPRH